MTARRAYRWEGSRGYAPAVRLADAIIARGQSVASPEEWLIASVMHGLLKDAHALVCPPEQLHAIPDDVFDDLGEAFDYARAARLPFASLYFDFLDEHNHAPLIEIFPPEMNKPMELELRGVVAGELPDERQTAFLPIVAARGEPPEELGAVMLSWDERVGPEKPKRWRESITSKAGREYEITLCSVSAAMDAVGEQPRPIEGAVIGAARGAREQETHEALQFNLAVATAAATRTALKLLYMLDSTNVNLERMPVSRQKRRQTERDGCEIAWTVAVTPPKSGSAKSSDPASANYLHRFEVRGNFAHYGPDTQLYQRSPAETIRPCPRCGTCRRIWRPPHVKGPADKPLVVKIRRVDYAEESPLSA